MIKLTEARKSLGNCKKDETVNQLRDRYIRSVRSIACVYRLRATVIESPIVVERLMVLVQYSVAVLELYLAAIGQPFPDACIDNSGDFIDSVKSIAESNLTAIDLAPQLIQASAIADRYAETWPIVPRLFNKN